MNISKLKCQLLVNFTASKTLQNPLFPAERHHSFPQIHTVLIYPFPCPGTIRQNSKYPYVVPKSIRHCRAQPPGWAGGNIVQFVFAAGEFVAVYPPEGYLSCFGKKSTQKKPTQGRCWPWNLSHFHLCRCPLPRFQAALPWESLPAASRQFRAQYFISYFQTTIYRLDLK